MMKNSMIVVTVCLLLVSISTEAQDKIAPTHTDVRYGKFDRNVLDFWQAPAASAEKPASLLVYYHGGGWVTGDKGSFNPQSWLKAGISVASINYRFTQGHKDAAPYPAPMEDGARALQFLRSKAKDWHIDPDRVALSGGSAGAVITLWIGLRDDMKNPKSTDPIERISTRVTCLLPTNVPTTVTPKTILSRIGGNPSIHPAFLPLFGAEQIADLDKPAFASLVKDADPFTHVSKDDPPTFCLFTQPMTKTPLPPTTDFNTSIHHPEFGVFLKEKLDEVGVEAHVQWKGDEKKPYAPYVWLTEQLGVNAR